MRLSTTHLTHQPHPESVPVGRVCHLSFSPWDDTRALVAILDKPDEDSVLSLWDISPDRTPTRVLKPVQHGFVIRSGWIEKDRVWTATRRCGEGYAELRVQTLGDRAGEETISATRDGRVLWMAPDLSEAWLIDREGCLNYADIATGEHLHHIPTHLFRSRKWDPFIPMPALTPDASWLVAVKGERTLCVLDLPSGDIRAEFDVDDDVSSMALFHDTKILAFSSFDPTVRVWDLRDQTLRARLEGPSDVSSIAHLPNNRLFASYVDSPPQIWDLTTHTAIACDTPPEHDGHQGITNLTRLHPDGRHFLTVHQNHLLHVWDLHTGALTHVHEAPDPITALALHHDGRILVGDIIGCVTLLQSTP